MDFQALRTQLLSQTRQRIATAISEDILIIQMLAASDDLTVHVNNLVSRLREWHGYFLPEVGHQLEDNQVFAQVVATSSYEELKEKYVGSAIVMGAKPDTYAAVVQFATTLNQLYIARKELLDALEASMRRVMPNVQALAGTTIGARLLAEAGSLRSLALMPASTVQLLGAEKALFRHLRGGSRSPKHGHIFNHQLLQQAKKDVRGKVARALGDKLALCAKIDFFKGEFQADAYLKDLQSKFNQQ